MDRPVGGGINKWHVRLLFHSEAHMKEEERKRDGEKRKRELSPPHLSRTLMLSSIYATIILTNMLVVLLHEDLTTYVIYLFNDVLFPDRG